MFVKHSVDQDKNKQVLKQVLDDSDNAVIIIAKPKGNIVGVSMFKNNVHGKDLIPLMLGIEEIIFKDVQELIRQHKK